jgi:hypothetical protein
VTVITPTDTVLTAPHIRIALDPFKLQDLLLQDSVVFQNQDSFLTYFKGLHIRMTGASQTMLGISLVTSVSGLTFYYDKDELMDREFKFLFTSASIKTVYMEHDYTGSLVGDALSADPEDAYWFVQGLSGVTTYMRVDGLDVLGDAIINEADLEFYATFPDGDMGQFYPPCPVVITQEKTDTSLIYSEDVIEALSRSLGIVNNTTFELLYGGNLEEVMAGPPAIYRYNVKLTHQVRDIYRGKQENVIYFNPFSKGDVPNRAVIFGPGHPTYAPRLRIYYTAL